MAARFKRTIVYRAMRKSFRAGWRWISFQARVFVAVTKSTLRAVQRVLESKLGGALDCFPVRRRGAYAEPCGRVLKNNLPPRNTPNSAGPLVSRRASRVSAISSAAKTKAIRLLDDLFRSDSFVFPDGKMLRKLSTTAFEERDESRTGLSRRSSRGGRM